MPGQVFYSRCERVLISVAYTLIMREVRREGPSYAAISRLKLESVRWDPLRECLYPDGHMQRLFSEWPLASGEGHLCCGRVRGHCLRERICSA